MTIFDALTYAGNLASIRDRRRRPALPFVHGDICDQDDVLDRMDGHDAVVHFAAETHVDRSIKDPYSFVRTNCFGTNVLCDVARQVGVERFLHISTDEVYGSIEPARSARPIRSTPRSPYSAAKAGSDLIALSLLHHATACRCSSHGSSNNFGPYQFPEKVIPLFITNLLDGAEGAAVRRRRERPRLDPRRGPQHGPPISCCVAGTVGEIYNIGAGNEITNRELTHRLLELTGRDESFIEPVADRLGHDRRYSITTTRSPRSAGRPSTTSTTRCGRTVEWYRDNRDWWEPLKARAAF